MKVGDLVLVVDPLLHRNDWKLGRVTVVGDSQNGLVRLCTVRTRAGVYERAVTELCMLEATQMLFG